MPTSETAKLLASLELKDKFSPTIKNANRALGQFDSKLSNTEGRAYKAGQQIGTGLRNVGKLAVVGMGIVATNVALGLDSLIKLENQTAQTEAVIKSTGGAAGVSAKDVRALAESYEALNAQMGDEVIQSGANLLLTFTNVQKRAFEPALATALDMNTALGKGPDGLTQTVRVLGKALNDPTKGLSALGRVGITFTKEQQKRIKGLQEEGKLYEAQTIILGELDKRFGGSFLAQGNTTAGSVAKFTDSIEDLQRSLATAALPAVRNIADALTELMADPDIQQGAKDLGREIGNLFSKQNIKDGAKALGDAFALIKDAAPAIKSALGTVGTVLRGAVDAFMALPPEVRALLVGGVAVNKLTGGLLSNVAGGIFGALKAMTVQAGVVHVNGGIVKGGGIPGVPTAAGGGAAAAGGGGLGALALPVTIGVLTSAAAQAAVTEFNKGTGFQTMAPKFGLFDQAVTGLGNVVELIKVATGERPLPKADPELVARLAALRDQADRTKDDTVAATEKVTRANLETKREAVRGLAIVKSQTASSGSAIQSTTRSSAAGIEAAVRASRVTNFIDVNVSAGGVTTVNTRTTRTGPTDDSRNRDDVNGTGRGR